VDAPVHAAPAAQRPGEPGTKRLDGGNGRVSRCLWSHG